MAVDQAAYQRRVDEMGELLADNKAIDLDIAGIEGLLKKKKKNLKSLQKLSKLVSADLDGMAKERKSEIADLKDVE